MSDIRMKPERLIDAVAFAEEIESLEIIVAGSSARWYDAQHTVLRRIAEQPTVEAYTEQDVRDAFNDGYSKGAEQPVKRGRWVDAYGDTVGMVNGIPWSDCWCGECGEHLTGSGEYPAKGYYCPNCGAKMDLECKDG